MNGGESQAGPPGLALRARRREDARAIAALSLLPGFRAGTLRPPFPSEASMEARIAAAKPNDVDIVAEIDGTLVGFGGVWPHLGRRAHAGEIGLGVHDAWCGKGVGTALMAALVEAGERWMGLRRLELTVFADNAPAVRLYERFGFRVEGRLAAFALRNGAYEDALAMARLGGPAWPVCDNPPFSRDGA